MSIENDWEAKLRDMGMPSEIASEEEVAREAGVELVTADMLDPEAQALANKLRQEDSRNIFGGFPNSTNNTVSLVESVRGEWLAQGINEKDIRLTIHASCVNRHDCVTLSQHGGKSYHYNTKQISHYSREDMMKKLLAHGLTFKEK